MADYENILAQLYEMLKPSVKAGRSKRWKKTRIWWLILASIP